MYTLYVQSALIEKTNRTYPVDLAHTYPAMH
jgi:hypothetical protein